jgi:hypothetical protein
MFIVEYLVLSYEIIGPIISDCLKIKYNFNTEILLMLDRAYQNLKSLVILSKTEI